MRSLFGWGQASSPSQQQQQQHPTTAKTAEGAEAEASRLLGHAQAGLNRLRVVTGEESFPLLNEVGPPTQPVTLHDLQRHLPPSPLPYSAAACGGSGPKCQLFGCGCIQDRLLLLLLGLPADHPQRAAAACHCGWLCLSGRPEAGVAQVRLLVLQ